ncbi:MAG: hypothetical protein K6T90_21620, partial [Leptolyngbyaceae cyanobacterium HOT.MB2.61]|nr:hypothetical protein [Leptolyngbyaceae cyanobacterium HOT.MB2.61]
PATPSRKQPCLKLVVIVTRNFWVHLTLVPPQGTFTPLDHAHAGRTQRAGADGARDQGSVAEVISRRYFTVSPERLGSVSLSVGR